MVSRRTTDTAEVERGIGKVLTRIEVRSMLGGCARRECGCRSADDVMWLDVIGKCEGVDVVLLSKTWVDLEISDCCRC